jgi:ribonucleoside-diphosphate reductase alpha chain
MSAPSVPHTSPTVERDGAGAEPVPGAPPLTPNALHVLQARYLRRDAQRAIIETPDEMFARVARAIADAELRFGGPADAARWEREFRALLRSLEFLPNSPTLMNAGTALGQLSACFVLGLEDSLESIFGALGEMALVQRTGGGTGFSFSALRPAGATLASTKGEASGPVSFMHIFDCATEHIKQGGRRRGANMGVLRVDHPDILAFIGAKQTEGALRNFNLSVAVTDAFMRAVRDDATIALIDPQTQSAVAQRPAREIFNAIVEAAWRNGDPGLLFLDAVDRANPTPQLGRIEATNPCGETPLLPYESCNLGSINLARMTAVHAGKTVVDWARLAGTTCRAVRFLDDVIEVSRYPGEAFDRAARRTRKIGLGVMGFAELLVRVGIPYDSDAAVELADHLMEHIARAARRASRGLAEARGTFPAWPGSTLAREGRRERNATCTAIAPTGTISIIAGTTASIEPMFALAYRRRHVLAERTLTELTPLLDDYCATHAIDCAAVRRRLTERGSLRDAADLPREMRALFATALEIPARRHLAVQAAFQRHTDNAVSKTVNLPHDATVQDVAGVYWHAWELGLKGITVYRYGSRESQVLELGAAEEAYHYDHAARCDPTECRV